MKTKYVYGLSLLLLLSACQKNTQEVEQTKYKKNAPSAENMIPIDVGEGENAEVFWQNIEKDSDYYAKIDVFLSSNETNKNWEQVHKSAQNLLDEAQNRSSYRVMAIMIGQEMLKRHLLPVQETTNVYKSALAYYVTLLDVSHHIDLSTMRQALDKLKGHWSNEKISAVAKNTLKYNLKKSQKYKQHAQKMNEKTINDRSGLTNEEKSYQDEINKIANGADIEVQMMQSFINKLR